MCPLQGWGGTLRREFGSPGLCHLASSPKRVEIQGRAEGKKRKHETPNSLCNYWTPWARNDPTTAVSFSPTLTRGQMKPVRTAFPPRMEGHVGIAL